MFGAVDELGNDSVDTESAVESKRLLLSFSSRKIAKLCSDEVLAALPCPDTPLLLERLPPLLFVDDGDADLWFDKAALESLIDVYFFDFFELCSFAC